MKNKWHRRDLLFVIFIPVFLVGCQQSQVRDDQEKWGGRLGDVYVFNDELIRHQQPNLTTGQLKVLVGEPDYILSPMTFLEAVNRFKNHECDVLVFYLWQEYGRGKNGGEYVIIHDYKHEKWNEVSRRWRNDPDFLKTSIWIYDETKHFSHPIPEAFGSVPIGFKCFCFVIENSRVMENWVFLSWKPGTFSAFDSPATSQAGK
jgi:hypothetical protein